MHIYQDITGLINRAIQAKLIETRDYQYCLNQVLHLLKINTFPEKYESNNTDDIPVLLEKIVSYAVHQHIIKDTFDEKDIFKADLMNIFVARPSVITKTFNDHYTLSAEKATDYFYELSKNSNYIQTAQIKKNVHFKTESPYGNLDITINLSKPEKDPEQIKREREMKQTVKYPKCLLCAENEGYAGRIGHPARSNHRMIPIELTGENWYLQYSPYVYYNEHCILLAEEHRNMKINADTFTRLLNFVEMFPHYFIGSNADLPIVGGSILTHDHYQGGHYTFAMENAESIYDFHLDKHPNVDLQLLKWPLSVIRLKGSNKESLIHCADDILQTWLHYTDKDAKIMAFTEETRHNTITPIARMRDGGFELDLVLRNNRTTAEYPLGIFHPHADVHHIKKENIGLIEVMGLAVLPARLQQELAEIKAFLLGEKDQVEEPHIEWATQLKDMYGTLSSASEVDEIIHSELGKKFTRVLEDAGVFKQTGTGIGHFKQFIATL